VEPALAEPAEFGHRALAAADSRPGAPQCAAQSAVAAPLSPVQPDLATAELRALAARWPHLSSDVRRALLLAAGAVTTI